MRNILIASILVFGLAACESKPESAASEAETSAATTTETAEEATEVVDQTATCEQAYEDLVELVKGLEEQFGESDEPMPERETFIASCERLPPEIQRCMVFEYGMAHQDECEKRVQALDPDQRSRAQKLMGK